jgi:acyl carrier protein
MAMQAFRSSPLRPSTSLLEYEISEQRTLVREIQALLLEKLSIRVESARTDLLQTGTLDSVAQVHLLLHLEKHFGVRLPMEDLEVDSFLSIENIAQMVAKCMRAQAESQTATSDISAQSDLISEIQALLLDKLSIRVEIADTDLYQTGIFDSMTLVQFIVQMEEHFGFHLPMEDLEPDSFRSVASIAELVARRTQNSTATDDAREALRISV